MIWGLNVPWDYDLVDYQRMHMLCCESDDDVLLMLLMMHHHQYYKMMMTERCIAVAAAVSCPVVHVPPHRRHFVASTR